MAERDAAAWERARAAVAAWGGDLLLDPTMPTAYAVGLERSGFRWVVLSSALAGTAEGARAIEEVIERLERGEPTPEPAA